ncbi:diguanylate cyclase [Luteimonas vadosa]|uniref:diguanylate cyclase n=1 Tax=Luteimonas vadosa TaxID=1165507 RepID=A0ABP9E9T9_9GAMM
MVLARILLACILALVGATAKAAPVLVLGDDGTVPLTPRLSYRHDSEGVDRPEDAWRHVDAGDFAPLPDGSAAFGFQRGAFWFHVPIVNRNPDEQRWLLVQQYALSDHIDVYARYRDGRVVHQAGGDALPFAARSVRYRHPNFMLNLPVGEQVDVLVRVKSQSSMQVPLVLYTRTAFTELSRDAQFAIGLYYGILLALFFYNLVLWLTLRDASYFWYLFHITAFGMVLFCLNGLGFEYLWPTSPWLADKSVPLSISLALIGMHQFSRVFLELPQRWPPGNRVSLAAILVFAAFAVAATLMPYRTITPIVSLAVLLSIIWISIVAVVVLRRGYTPARLFLLSWAMFLAGTGAFTLVAFGVLPKTFLTEYSVQIGSALEVLLLSIALSHRYAALRNENERIVGEANRRLERKVAQRTQEVRSTLTQLEDAHRQLSESSRRDGLTGLYNRTHFHDAFETMLEDASREGSPVSVLMIDLDHFKSINDEHGHLVGDDCLRAAAHRLGSGLRAHDALLARFGGEEFVVALPGRNLQQAVSIAETLRRSLVAEPCVSHGRTVRISASIGVHTVHPDGGRDADSALQVADQALYQAKDNGRDCVRTALTAA